MSESGPFAKALAIGGTIADGLTNGKHIVAIGAALFSASGAIYAFLENHVIIASGAGAVTLAVLTGGAVSYLDGRVHRGREERRMALLADIQGCHQEFMNWVLTQTQPLSKEAFQQLLQLHTAFLTRLCEVAARLFEIQRPRKGPFSANIKRVFVAMNETHEPEAHYTQLTRYVGADGDARLAFERDQFAKPTKLADNYIYNRMFSTRISEDFYMDKDISPLVRELRDQRYLHPNDKTLPFYRSLAVYPIYGTLPHTGEREAKDWFVYNQLKVAGTLCVDSPRTKAFDDAKRSTREQDLSTLKLLGGLAFSSFQLVSTASAIGVVTGMSPDRADESIQPVTAEPNIN